MSEDIKLKRFIFVQDFKTWVKYKVAVTYDQFSKPDLTLRIMFLESWINW